MAINRSPLNSHLEETLSGAATIRAYGFQQQFIGIRHIIRDRTSTVSNDDV